MTRQACIKNVENSMLPPSRKACFGDNVNPNYEQIRKFQKLLTAMQGGIGWYARWAIRDPVAQSAAKCAYIFTW